MTTAPVAPAIAGSSPITVYVDSACLGWPGIPGLSGPRFRIPLTLPATQVGEKIEFSWTSSCW